MGMSTFVASEQRLQVPSGLQAPQALLSEAALHVARVETLAHLPSAVRPYDCLQRMHSAPSQRAQLTSLGPAEAQLVLVVLHLVRMLDEFHTGEVW